METVKRQRGRPALPEGVRRRHKFEVPLNDREYLRILMNANRAGLPMATWIREQALRSDDPQIFKVEG
jgi:hypothetical protein